METSKLSSASIMDAFEKAYEDSRSKTRSLINGIRRKIDAIHRFEANEIPPSCEPKLPETFAEKIGYMLEDNRSFNLELEEINNHLKTISGDL